MDKDKVQLLLEAERRGLLPQDKLTMVQEARKRGLMPPPLDAADRGDVAAQQALPQALEPAELSADSPPELAQMQVQDTSTPESKPTGVKDYLRGIYRAGTQGSLLGFGDEFEALLRSAQSRSLARMPGVGPALVAARLFLSPEGKAENYGDALSDVRGNITQFREENPGTAFATELGGAILTPGLGWEKAAVKGASVLPRLLKNFRKDVAIGSGYGATYGFGASGAEEGDEDEGFVGGAKRRLLNSLLGGAVGGATGGVVSGITRGGTPLVRKLIGKGAETPEKTAASKIIEALDTDRKLAESGGPLEALSAEQAGKIQGSRQPLMNLDTGGEALRRLAKTAANESVEAGARLKGAVTQRNREQVNRFTDELEQLSEPSRDLWRWKWIQNMSAPENIRKALAEEARTSRSDFYKKAFEEGKVGVGGEWFERLKKAPDVRRAMSEADRRIANMEASGAPTTGKFARNPDGTLSDSHTLEYWDLVKQSLDGMIGDAKRQEKGGLVREYTILKNALVTGLDKRFPSYVQARGKASEIFGTGDALSAGEKFARMSPRSNADAVKTAIADMTPQELRAFREGYIATLKQKLSGVKDSSDLSASILGSTEERQRIALAFGDDALEGLRQFVDNEQRMQQSFRDVTGGSQTAQYLGDLMKLAAPATTGTAGFYLGDSTPGKVAYGAGGALLGRLLAAGRGKVSAKDAELVANEISRLLASKDPTVLRQAIKKTVEQPSSNDLTSALRRIFTRAATQSAAGGY